MAGRGLSRIALLPACVALVAVSALAIAAPEPAGAHCENGQEWSFMTSFCQEDPLKGTCNWNAVYRGISRDMRTDGSCVWVQFADNHGTHNYGWACTTSGTGFEYWDPTPYGSYERLCKSGLCSVWWPNVGY